MFPRHVRWYRLLLLLLVVVNCDEAIAKTDNNLNLDAGSDIFIVCPSPSYINLGCGETPPPIPASFLNVIADGDLADFMALGGSISGDPCGDIIVTVNENNSTGPQGCNTTFRSYSIYEDANSNGVADPDEITDFCFIEYTYDNQAPNVFGTSGLFTGCSDPDFEQVLSEWLSNAGAKLHSIDCNSVTITNNFPGIEFLNTCSSFQYVVDFTFTDACGLQTVVSETLNYDAYTDVFCDIVFVDCSNLEMLDPVTSVPEFEYYFGEVVLCGDDITVSHEDIGEPVNFCDLDFDFGYFERIYTFTDNTCGTEYECAQFIEYYYNEPFISCPVFNCQQGYQAPATTIEELIAQGGFVNGCGDLTLTYVDSYPNISGNDFCTVGSLERTYTVTDFCGNSSSCTQFFEFDNIVELTCPPTGNLINCMELYQSSGTMSPEELALNGGFSSACNEYTLTYVDSPSDVVPCDFTTTITRALTLTTACGATAQCSYQFNFGNFGIVTSCPSYNDPFDSFDDIPPAAANLSEYLANGGSVSGSCSSYTLTHSETINPSYIDGLNNLVRTYEFINECNVIQTCNEFIQFFGAAPAAIEVDCDLATDIVVDCNDAVPTGPTINDLVLSEISTCTDVLEAGASSMDGQPITIVNDFSSITYTGSGTTQDIIFTVSDGSGNSIECTKSVTIIGECMFGVDCSLATDIVVDCNDAGPSGPTIADLIAIELDNCGSIIGSGSTSPDGGSVTVTNNFTGLPYTGSGSTQDVIFTVTDNQGVETECVKSVTIIGECGSITCPPAPATLTCADGFLNPITSFTEFVNQGGSYEFFGCGTLSITSSDDIAFADLDFCSTDDIEINRTYTLTDGCGTEFTCVRVITYARNTEGPVMVCPADVTVDVNSTTCTYTATLTPPTATSTCSSIGVVSVTSQFVNNEVDLEEGSHIIEWKATNECGQITICEQVINVVGTGDDFAIICEGSEMAFLEANGFANVPAEQFVNEIYDACGSSGPYVYQIRRLSSGPCSNGSGTIYSPFISVCCEDIAVGSVDVSIRVTDTNGNQAVCTAEVQVKDLIPPSLVSCPTDTDVSCTQILDLANLSAYGFPTASDNCPGGMTIVETVEDLREDCGFGEIIRTFTVTDIADNIVTCSQTLNVYNNDPLELSDIVWPADNTYTNLCNYEIPGPDVAGVPAYPVNVCSQPLVTSSDNTIISGPGCMVVERVWVVLDWCQFDSGSDATTYRWEHTQILTLQNNISPEFDACDSFVENCGNELTCTGMINLSVSATDDCAAPDELDFAYTLTLESGAIINGQGNAINAPYPYGEHSIVWSVTDQCGNFTTCAQTVHIKDCKAPNAICLSGININLTQMPGNVPMAEIWANDLNVSTTDNCTATEDLEYAFDLNFTQPSKIFDCSDAGTSQLVVMYVRDLDGNIGFCKTSIGVQDNHNLCTNIVSEDDEEVMIAGRITTETNLTMEYVDVMLENSASPMHYMTDQNGLYAFENLPMYDDFNLVPSFEDEILNGISTADILLIQRHILDIERLDSPYKIIAADVNNSENITGVDIIELRKVILGLKDEFNNSTVWRFVDPSTGMTDPENPFPYTENMNLPDLDHNAYNMDFVGVKTGDVNYSALINGFIPETNISTRSHETLRLISNSVERGSIQLTVNTDQLLTGFQLAFRISGSMDQFNLSSSIIDIDESNYAIYDDVVRISWSSGEAINLAEGTELFTMRIGEDADYELLNDLPLFESEAYDASIRSMGIEINLEDNLVDDEWQVFRNTPNPFVDNTFIPFTAPRESKLMLSVFDVNGKLLFQETRNVAEGYQKCELSATDLGNVHGVLYYRLESGDFSSTQPFIRLK